MKNKIKYKVVSNEPVISKKEIEDMKDFDKILSGSANYPVVKTGLFNNQFLSKIVMFFGVAVALYAVFEFIYEPLSKKDFETHTDLPTTANSIKSSDKINLILVDDEKEEVIIDNETVLKPVKEVKNHAKNLSTSKKYNYQKKTENQRINKEAVTKKVQTLIENSEKKPFVVIDSTQSKQVKVIPENIIIKARPKEGYANLYDYFNKALADPNRKRTSNKEGTVMVSFIIGKNGEVKDVKVENSLDQELDLEAIKITESMPEWNPATRDNIPLESKLKIPITFKVEIKSNTIDNN